METVAWGICKGLKTARRDSLETSFDNKDYKKQVQDILYDNYIKLALVNIDTGDRKSVV